MPRDSFERVCEDRIAEGAELAGVRYVDMRIDVVHCPKGCTTDGMCSVCRPLYTVGGVWDRRAKDWADREAETSKIIKLHSGQLEAALWWSEWLASYLAGEDPTAKDTERVFSALFGGGRRGGKTYKAAACVGQFAVAAPGSLGWIVSESIPKSDEVDRAFRASVAKQWYRDRGFPWWEYRFINESWVWQKSAHDTEDLKQGRADLVFLNEGQKLGEAAYVNARGAIVDTGGVVIVAANPPKSSGGVWVLDFHDAVKEGERKAKYFHFDYRENPHVNHEALEALADEVDERTAAMEIDGEFLRPTDVVCWNWKRGEKGSERPLPELGEITRQVIQREVGKAYHYAFGMDFQRSPYIAAVSLRLFTDPEDPKGVPLCWWDQAYDVAGDEDDMIDLLEAEGYTAANTVIVGDASGEWQDKDGNNRNPSFERIRARGFRIVQPDRKYKRNPPIELRVRNMLRLIKTADLRYRDEHGRRQVRPGKRRQFADPEINRTFLEAVHKWPNTRRGKPSRSSKFAHYMDAATYVQWRLCPPPKGTRGKLDIKIVSKPKGRARMKGW